MLTIFKGPGLHTARYYIAISILCLTVFHFVCILLERESTTTSYTRAEKEKRSAPKRSTTFGIIKRYDGFSKRYDWEEAGHIGILDNVQSEQSHLENTDFHEVATLDPDLFSMQVTNNMIDSFQVKLPHLLEGYKNPCWLEQVPEDFTYADSYYNRCVLNKTTGGSKFKHHFEAFQEQALNKTMGYRRIRCFPYFFLLGVSKCGTTDIFDTLNLVSKYLAGTFLKESHYWEWKRCRGRCADTKRGPQFGEYLDTLDVASESVRQKTVSGNDTKHHPLIIGDFSPSTLTFYPCWQSQPGNTDRQEPLYTTAHHIYSIRPQTKFIVIMRDPVDRVYSNYMMKLRLKNDSEHQIARPFHAEVLKAIIYLNECMETRTPRACAYSVMRFDSMTHVTNSLYEIFIRDWISVFPRDQFLFLRLEDYGLDRVPSVKAIHKFLDLEELSPVQEQTIANMTVRNNGNITKEMFVETKELLRDFFRPFNTRLVALLGDESYNWGY